MGNSSSQTVKDYITNNVGYQQTVAATLNLQNNSTVDGISVNNFTITNGKADCCVVRDAIGNIVRNPDGTPAYLPGCSANAAQINCNLNVSQTAKNNTKVVQSIDSKFSEQLTTQLQNTTQADISNALDQLQQNDLFSGAFNATRQNVESDITNNINTALNTQTTLNIVNSAVINSKSENNAIIYNCGVLTGTQCNFDQNASTEIVVQNILSSVGDLAQSNSQINDFYTKVNNALTQKQEGIVGTISSALEQLFSELGTAALILIIGGGLVVFIIIVIVVSLVFFKGGGKEIAQQAAGKYLGLEGTGQTKKE